MTKYILHGGYEIKYENHSNNRFFEEVAASLPQKSKLLFVFWAQEEDYALKREKLIEKITAASNGKAIDFEEASPETFSSQVRDADMIYMYGGSPEALLEKLSMHDEVQTFLTNTCKVVVGTSAGACALCHSFYTLNGFNEGLEVLPFNVLVHSDNPEFMSGKKIIEEKGKKGLPLLLIPETEFVMLEY